MDRTDRNSFIHAYDGLFRVFREKKKGYGEDAYYCVGDEECAIASVFDGCGGAGSETYPLTYKNYPGAYMASHTVSGILSYWYRNLQKKNYRSAEELRASLQPVIELGLTKIAKVKDAPARIKSKMLRPFPTTMAMVYAQKHKDGILLHALWAGDSRVYILDEAGLAQITEDDTNVPDALESITNDGVLKNLLSADMKHTIHTKSLLLKKPALIFSCTDGCFGYFWSPMEFEYEILSALQEAVIPTDFEKNLYQRFKAVAQDDFSMCMLSFYYESFENMKAKMKKRTEYVKANYIDPLKKLETSDELEEKRNLLWSEYRKNYEYYLRKDNEIQ